MLPRHRRLRTDRDYKNTARSRRVLRGANLTIRVISNPLEHHRYGFVVSRRTAKRAVDRNRIKRCLRAAVRYQIGQPKHSDLMIVANPGARQATNATLAKELTDLLGKL